MGEDGPDYNPGDTNKNPESQEATQLAAELLELMRQVDEPLRKLSPFVEAGNPTASDLVRKLDGYTDSEIADSLRIHGPLEQQSVAFLRGSIEDLRKALRETSDFFQTYEDALVEMKELLDSPGVHRILENQKPEMADVIGEIQEIQERIDDPRKLYHDPPDLKWMRGSLRKVREALGE